MLDLPVNDTDAPVSHRAEAERERMPLRIQNRIRDAGRR
jgi:hypothetical protein